MAVLPSLLSPSTPTLLPSTTQLTSVCKPTDTWPWSALLWQIPNISNSCQLGMQQKQESCLTHGLSSLKLGKSGEERSECDQWAGEEFAAFMLWKAESEGLPTSRAKEHSPDASPFTRCSGRAGPAQVKQLRQHSLSWKWWSLPVPRIPHHPEVFGELRQ